MSVNSTRAKRATKRRGVLAACFKSLRAWLICVGSNSRGKGGAGCILWTGKVNAGKEWYRVQKKSTEYSAAICHWVAQPRNAEESSDTESSGASV